MQGYCVRCKQKQTMLSATRTVMKNGRRAMIGTCACCATPIYVAGLWEEETPSSPESVPIRPGKAPAPAQSS